MIKDHVYEKLALANAQAIKGLEPKITIWNTGENPDSTSPIRNIMQSLPPLLSTIQEQIGITPPSWMAQMPPQDRPYVSTTSDNKALTNGMGKQDTR